MSEYSGERDKAVADFFKSATELLKLCAPLLKAAIKETEDKARLKGRSTR